MVGGTAEEAKEHVRLSWERGQRALEVLWARLPEELRDVLVPLRKGGVNFCKMMSTMNDTCNAARLMVAKVRELKEAASIAHYGLEGWAALPDSEKMCLSYLCLNHARGLPVDEFNRMFEEYMEEELGD